MYWIFKNIWNAGQAPIAALRHLAVLRIPFAFTLRVRFTDGCRRGRIFHFSTAKALRNGYDSLSQPAVTAPPAVSRVPISYVLTDLLLGRLSHGPYYPNNHLQNLFGCLDAAA